jgi:hypothetical protein
MRTQQVQKEETVVLMHLFTLWSVLLELCNGFIRGGSDRSQYDEEVAAEEVQRLNIH